MDMTGPINPDDLRMVMEQALSEGKEIASGMPVKYLVINETINRNREKRIYIRVRYACPAVRNYNAVDGGMPSSDMMFVTISTLSMNISRQENPCHTVGINLLVEEWIKKKFIYRLKLYEGYIITQWIIRDSWMENGVPDGMSDQMYSLEIRETLDNRIIFLSERRELELTKPGNLKTAQSLYNRSVKAVLNSRE